MLRAFLWALFIAIAARVLDTLRNVLEPLPDDGFLRDVLHFVATGLYYFAAVGSWFTGAWFVLEFLIWAWAHM